MIITCCSHSGKQNYISPTGTGTRELDKQAIRTTWLLPRHKNRYFFFCKLVLHSLWKPLYSAVMRKNKRVQNSFPLERRLGVFHFSRGQSVQQGGNNLKCIKDKLRVLKMQFRLTPKSTQTLGVESSIHS